MDDAQRGELRVPERGLGRGSRAATRPVNRLPIALQQALERARAAIWCRRRSDGSWAGEVSGDIAASIDYLLLTHLLGTVESDEQQRLVAGIRAAQLPLSAWSGDAEGPVDLSLSVRAYLALKLAGCSADEPFMVQACQAIQALGGAERANGMTRILLARFGQCPYASCPAIPPEILLLPPRAPLSLFRVPLPSRLLLVALALVWATRQVFEVPAGQGIEELISGNPRRWRPCAVGRDESVSRWPPNAWIVRSAERCASWLERHRFHVLRSGALLLAQKWLRERAIMDDEAVSSMAVIFWTATALSGISHEAEARDRQACLRAARRLAGAAAALQRPELLSAIPANAESEGAVAQENANDDDKLSVAPWQTAVLDTARALRCLAVRGGMDLADSHVRRAVDWLLQHEITKALDPPRSHRYDIGGWCLLQPRSRHPDVESTAEVLLALRTLFASQPSPPTQSEDSMVAMVQANRADLARLQVAVLDRVAAASRRGRRWLLDMQNQDGGWGRFERYGRRSWLQYSAWSGSFATRDPSSPEVTGAVLEALGRWELRCGRAAIDRAVDFLGRTQNSAGFWDGQWTINPFYATWRAVEGLASVGIPPADPAIQAAARWVLKCQHSDGSWGVLPRRTPVGPQDHGLPCPSATQTAWALMIVLAAGHAEREAVRRGFDYLAAEQTDQGTWPATCDLRIRALGMARCRHELNAVYFPYLALARWAELPWSKQA